MKCYIGMGSNLGDRESNIENAALKIRDLCGGSVFRVSPIYQTKAHVPLGGSDQWRLPFLNAVIEAKWDGDPRDLLQRLKEIESSLGRVPGPRWGPRVVDLDLLALGSVVCNEADFTLPHSELWDRSFVLDPLKDLAPSLRIPAKEGTVLSRARFLWGHTPLWMGILNLTPDSFSDGDELTDMAAFESRIQNFWEAGVQIFDLGAESTRPGAQAVVPGEEWRRLKPKLEFLRRRFQGKIFHPQISVDTRHGSIAELAMEAGAHWINDVSGLDDPHMLNVLRNSTCNYVLTHSLSVPPTESLTLPDGCDPVVVVKQWAWEKLETLTKNNINLDRVIFDPGIGFGKTPQQSLAVLRRLEELKDLPVRILVGHSRKSFMKAWRKLEPHDRDWEGVGISLSVARKGVDILRVHAPSVHIRAHQAWMEVNSSDCVEVD